MVPREGRARPAAADKKEVGNVHVPRHIRRGIEPAASVRPLPVLAIIVAVAALPPVHSPVQRRLVGHAPRARPRHARPRRGGGSMYNR